MGVLTCTVLFLTLGLLEGLAPAPSLESDEFGQWDVEEAERFLRRNGFEDFDEVVLSMKLNNGTDCLDFPDVRARVVQLCLAQTIIEQCRNGTDLIVFHDCRNRECFGSFDPTTSRCLLDAVGVQVEPEMQGDGWTCGLSRANANLFQWMFPEWQRAIGGVNNVGCMLSMPSGSIVQNRVSCRGRHPVIDTRIVFPSDEVLRDRQGQVQCVVRQFCEDVAEYSSQTVCFETRKEFEPDDVLIRAQDSDNDLENDHSRSEIPIHENFLLFFIFLILAVFAFY